MHPLQKRLLDLTATHELDGKSLREIGDLLGEKHPQKIKHHLSQLELRGLIEIDRERRLLRKPQPRTSPHSEFINIPILGSANCGSATVYAEESIEGYLRVSNKVLDPKGGLFALRAIGNSMNKANVCGVSIEDGDYVIIDGEKRDPQNDTYVLSVIEDLANIKKFKKDIANEQIVLLSESTQHSPPIVIHPDDTQYIVCGTVVRVIKKT
jgi:SOS-response transcriptional repressor LexA